MTIHDQTKDTTAERDPRYHYQVMARALALIETEGTNWSLEQLAARMGMSAAHFQRIFSRWVGISPKRYQQYLGIDLARRLLAERFTVLETSHEVGLSSTGRLHDLFLRWEAMSPGEYAQGGAGLTIRYGYTASPFGEALVMISPRGICGLGFTADCGREAALIDLKARWPAADFIADSAAIGPYGAALFRGEGAAQLHMIGAPFQIKVWEALLRVPSGHVTTYSEIARAIGHPDAQRAVGTAVGRNPISWLIPCHRALRKSGGLGGYHWGLPVKRALLAWEAARLDADAGRDRVA